TGVQTVLFRSFLTFNVDIMVTKTRNVVVFLDYATFPARTLIVVPLDGATTGTESACVLLYRADEFCSHYDSPVTFCSIAIWREVVDFSSHDCLCGENSPFLTVILSVTGIETGRAFTVCLTLVIKINLVTFTEIG